MAKYPDEAAIFRWIEDGEDYLLRPTINDDGDTCPRWFVSEDELVIASSAKIKPLTRAARQLLKWARQ